MIKREGLQVHTTTNYYLTILVYMCATTTEGYQSFAESQDKVNILNDYSSTVLQVITMQIYPTLECLPSLISPHTKLDSAGVNKI